MATPTSQKIPCATCGKVTGMFTCRGCQKDFCTRHVAEHRQELGKQMDELTLDHDRFRQILMEKTTEYQNHPLIKQIDEWEQQSIDIIHHAANNARQQLQKIISEQKTKLMKTLTEIADELRKAREDDEFFETDLKQWIQKLDQLKKDFTHPLNIKIQKENNTLIPSIPKIVETLSSNETFGRSIGTIQIEEIGQVIIKKQDSSYATVRGNGEYNSGQHRFRFKIEESPGTKWVFIGIVSKDVILEAKSYCNRSTYGWAGFNQVYLGGSCTNGFNGYQSDIEKNDVVQLFIDCDKQIIRLTNERTQSTNELQIDTKKCPFPWQLNFNLYHINDRIRIL